MRDNIGGYSPELYESLKERIVEAVGEDRSELEGILLDLETLNEGNVKNPVTGAPNGRQRDADLKRIVRRERGETKNSFYVMMLDIDDFGQFNKDYGEEVGNEVLRWTTKVLEDSLRTNDYVKEMVREGYSYHLHGEEKLAICVCSCDEDAIRVAERIRESIEKRSKVEMGYPVTESIGVTKWHLELEGYDYAQNRADRNMQVAKRKGKNRVYFEDKVVR